MDYDFHDNQWHHVYQTYDAIAMNLEFGKTTLSGSIFVPINSQIKTIEDLRGKNILFGGGHSAFIAYIANTWALRQAGLNAGDYQEHFALNPPSALIAIARNQGDAAAAGSNVTALPMVQKGGDHKKVRAITQTPAYPPPTLGDTLHPPGLDQNAVPARTTFAR